MSAISKEFEALPSFHGMKGASEADIDAAESKLGLKFSEDYRDYLAAFSLASVNGHELTGLCDSSRLNVIDVTESERARHGSIDPKWYAIERIGVDGAIAWQAHDGSVFRTTAHTSGIKVCDSLLNYLSR